VAWSNSSSTPSGCLRTKLDSAISGEVREARAPRLGLGDGNYKPEGDSDVRELYADSEAIASGGT
jgi:hypothetical protein